MVRVFISVCGSAKRGSSPSGVSKDGKRTFGGTLFVPEVALRNARFKKKKQKKQRIFSRLKAHPSRSRWSRRQRRELYIESSPLNMQAQTSFSVSLPSI